jgi:hypothetical protein
VDECVDQRIVAGLRRRGVDVVTAADAGLLSASDEEHLARAASLGRPIVTSDQDFLLLARTWIERDEIFPGLIFVQSGTRVGEAVTAIFLLVNVLDATDMVNWIEWVP